MRSRTFCSGREIFISPPRKRNLHKSLEAGAGIGPSVSKRENLSGFDQTLAGYHPGAVMIMEKRKYVHANILFRIRNYPDDQLHTLSIARFHGFADFSHTVDINDVQLGEVRQQSEAAR